MNINFSHKSTKMYAFLSFALLIFILAILPSDGVEMTFPYQDKLKHISAFFVLSYLYYKRSASKDHFKMFKVLLGYGALIEMVQLLVPYREFSIFDFVADAVGIVLFIVCFAGYSKYTNRGINPATGV